MTTIAASSRTSISAGFLLNLVFILLAITLIGSLVVQMAGSLTEFRAAGRISELAKADAVLFAAVQTLRLNRGEAQTTLQSQDDATAKLEGLRADSDVLVKKTLGGLSPDLVEGTTQRMAETERHWRAVAALNG